MIQLNKKLITTTFSLIILAEALSFVTYLYLAVNPWVFGLVALAALVLTAKKLEWGIWLIFAELAIGSFGKLFVLQIGGVELSIRIVLWLIVMSVWFAQVARARRISFLRSQFFKPYLALAVVLGWGIVWGLSRGHDFGAVFFDVNNYLYFLLVFPIYEIFSRRDKACLVPTITIIATAITWLSIKTIALFYIFSHELFGLQDILYAWSRHFQLAEITNINPTELTSRVFMQSQIWILFGLFIIMEALFLSLRGRSPQATDRSNPTIAIKTVYRIAFFNALIGLLRSAGASLAMTVILSTALIISFSRSFWLAGVLSLGVFLILLLIQRERFSRVFYFGILSVVIVALAVGLTLGVAAFPIPPGAPGGSSMLKERVEKFKEAAASSRVSQIRPLLTTIAKHPAIGSGFGQTVTYQSQDPRVVKSHPDGWYSTTAFELGWLEMWLKIGLLGVGVYLYLLWRILKATRIIRMHPNDPNKNSDRFLILGAMAGLIAIIVTHSVSPYLNHPLGIGVVLLLTCAFDSGQNRE